MKFLVILALFCAIVAVKAQLNLGLGLGIGRAGPPPPEFFQNVILNAEAQKVLATPSLPADLQQRVQDTLSNSQSGLNNCSTLTTLPWFQMRCVALQLSKSKAELKAIDDEAKARAQAAATAEASAPAAADAISI
ncbi:uncharacterized protein LOC126767658 [Bactrocera neohumeralis]|uniref:uncharacterized protein LOC120766660 n=1 Tax=Bactrocera tryoni TaxID=59916 RepID=UPI001A96CBF1|nr:uncharacterized protein LOC120766660 [Bactrocera tryoni]XP_050341100.1 uncharacterized protein LOC126767658 [Bactrocera neohumeralis]